MIRKLRYKLVAYATASIFVFLLLILGTINLVNFGMVAAEADNVTLRIANGEGPREETLPPTSSSSLTSADVPPGPTPSDPGGPGGPEMMESLRYFTVAFDEKGNGTIVAKKIMDQTVTDDAAISWASGLKGREKGWTETYFRFRTYQKETSTYVTVLYFDRELGPSYRILNASIAGGVGGTILSCLLLIPLSGLFVKPLVVSRKKQQRFISDASHELKTPLTIISTNKDIIEIENGESEASKAIDKQVSRMTDMVKKLNALALMDEEPKLVSAPFDLARTCAEMVDSFQGPLEKKGIVITTEIPAEHPFIGDEGAIRQLLSILLDNVLKYALTKAEFHLYVNKDRTTIKVANDAEVPDGSLDRVFERFYRSDDARASAKEGSGLGLSLAKEIVKNCGGRISAKGENGLFVIKAEL